LYQGFVNGVVKRSTLRKLAAVSHNFCSVLPGTFVIGIIEFERYAGKKQLCKYF